MSKRKREWLVRTEELVIREYRVLAATDAEAWRRVFDCDVDDPPDEIDVQERKITGTKEIE